MALHIQTLNTSTLILFKKHPFIQTFKHMVPRRPATLARLAARAAESGHRDGTVYGTSRLATKSFYAHHLRAISRVTAVEVAKAIERLAAAVRSHLVEPTAPVARPTLRAFLRAADQPRHAGPRVRA